MLKRGAATLSLVLTRQELYELYYQGPEPMVRLVENLLGHIAEVEHYLGHRQQQTIDSLSEQVTRLKRQLKTVKEHLAEQQCLNHQLQRRVAELEAMPAEPTEQVVRDSHNSHRPPSSDLPFIKRTRSLRRPSGKSVGGQVGHPGRTRLRVEQPDRVVTHRPSVCRGCGASLRNGYVVSCDARQVIDIPPVKPFVIEHRAWTKRCVTCGEVTKARFPKGIEAAVQYGDGVRARAVYLTKYQLLPVRRAGELLADFFGCAVSPATVMRMVTQCARALVRSEAQIKEGLRRAEVLNVDETGIRVAGAGHFVHVASTPQLTHYAYDRRRGKSAMDEIGILPVFKGVCVRDGWVAYDHYHHCRHALCNAHLLRELVYIEESHPHQRGQWAAPMAELLREIKAAVELARTAGRSELTADEQTRFTRRYERIIKRGVELNPPRQPSYRAPPKSSSTKSSSREAGRREVVGRGRVAQTAARNLVARLERYQNQVLRFMTDFSVPFDNNAAERDLRMLKLQQKTSGCFRSHEGAREFCRIRSLISTARKQGQSVLPTIEHLFTGQQIHLTS